jgi:hypothetical protein
MHTYKWLNCFEQLFVQDYYWKTVEKSAKVLGSLSRELQDQHHFLRTSKSKKELFFLAPNLVKLSKDALSPQWHGPVVSGDCFNCVV